MSPRDLLIDPCWSSTDLGQALPDSPHAVSVALPLWEDVIAYEEKDPKCLNSLQAIYPRFGMNPLIAEVASLALSNESNIYSTAWPYPTTAAAEAAQQHCKRLEPLSKTKVSKVLGLDCLYADVKATDPAKAFWQHTGIGASSRQAAIALNKEPKPSKRAGQQAKATLKGRLADIYQCDQKAIQLHPSGMAALNRALQLIREIHPGRATLQLGFPYVDVLKLPEVIFEGSRLLLKATPNELADALDRIQPSAVIVELPSNPMLECVDLPTVAKLAHARGIPVIADDTIGTALNIDVLPYADLVFSSLTKSFAGRGDILAGCLVISPFSTWRQVLQNTFNSTIAPLSDADSIALEEASRDVKERVSQLNNACLELVKRLAKHPSVSRVMHPNQCANFHSLMRPNAGYGCLVSLELKGGLPQAKKFYNALEVCKGPSLGTNFTLVCPYVLLAHYNELKWAESCGVPSHLIRISVGLEDSQKLWKRFKFALET